MSQKLATQNAVVTNERKRISVAADESASAQAEEKLRAVQVKADAASVAKVRQVLQVKRDLLQKSEIENQQARNATQLSKEKAKKANGAEAAAKIWLSVVVKAAHAAETVNASASKAATDANRQMLVATRRLLKTLGSTVLPSEASFTSNATGVRFKQMGKAFEELLANKAAALPFDDIAAAQAEIAKQHAADLLVLKWLVQKSGKTEALRAAKDRVSLLETYSKKLGSKQDFLERKVEKASAPNASPYQRSTLKTLKANAADVTVEREKLDAEGLATKLRVVEMGTEVKAVSDKYAGALKHAEKVTKVAKAQLAKALDMTKNGASARGNKASRAMLPMVMKRINALQKAYVDYNANTTNVRTHAANAAVNLAAWVSREQRLSRMAAMEMRSCNIAATHAQRVKIYADKTSAAAAVAAAAVNAAVQAENRMRLAQANAEKEFSLAKVASTKQQEAERREEAAFKAEQAALNAKVASS